MPPSAAPEYPPLLPHGFHEKTLEELTQMCVTAFPLSTTRSKIMQGLRTVIGRFLGAKIAGELWINGGFLTNSINPIDSDVVLAVDHVVYDTGTTLQRKTIDWIDSNLRAKHLCDSYKFFEYPVGHSNHADGIWMRAYWIRQFGFSRNDVPKGIALFKR